MIAVFSETGDSRIGHPLAENALANVTSRVGRRLRNPTKGVVLGLLGEPLGKALRIPCYEGLSPVRLTYSGFVRQIRGVLGVAMPQIPSTVGRRLLPRLSIGYQYLFGRTIGVSISGSGTQLREKAGVRVGA